MVGTHSQLSTKYLTIYLSHLLRLSFFVFHNVLKQMKFAAIPFSRSLARWKNSRASFYPPSFLIKEEGIRQQTRKRGRIAKPY